MYKLFNKNYQLFLVIVLLLSLQFSAIGANKKNRKQKKNQDSSESLITPKETGTSSGTVTPPTGTGTSSGTTTSSLNSANGIQAESKKMVQIQFAFQEKDLGRKDLDENTKPRLEALLKNHPHYEKKLRETVNEKKHVVFNVIKVLKIEKGIQFTKNSCNQFISKDKNLIILLLPGNQKDVGAYFWKENIIEFKEISNKSNIIHASLTYFGKGTEDLDGYCLRHKVKIEKDSAQDSKAVQPRRTGRS